jgi:hypothetical protein
VWESVPKTVPKIAALAAPKDRLALLPHCSLTGIPRARHHCAHVEKHEATIPNLPPSSGVYYLVETTTGKRESLNTKSLEEAKRLLHARNEAAANSTINLQIARAYLAVADPEVKRRTWRNVIKEVTNSNAGRIRLAGNAPRMTPLLS